MGPITYVVSFPRVFQEVKYPVPGCLLVAHSVGRLQEHFIYRNFWSKVVVVKEGEELLPRCDLCRMHMLTVRLIKHENTARCDKNTQIRWWRRDVAISDRC